MRIIHIISSPGAGGAEIYVKDLAIAMVEKGHDIRIMFLNNASDIGRDSVYQNEFLAALKQKQIPYEFIGYKARHNPFLGIYRVFQAARAFRPDIIHCHLYFAAIFCLLIRGPKIIYTHHNIKLSAPATIYKLLDLRVAAYIGICHACSVKLREITRKPVVRIDNGVDPRRIRPLSDANPNPAGQLTILVAGRLSQQKNLVLLLDALAQLADLKFTVKIAGEGPDRESLEHRASQLGLTEKVEFLGNVGNVPLLMSQADIYAMSSAWEGLPIALIEATLTGLPVIVTNVGGCAEVAHHACNGMVIDETTPEAYALGLRRLIESETLRTQLSRNALKYSGRYTLHTAVSAHLALYATLAGPGLNT